ncbi:MAG: hypothetical protein KGQ52_14605, partial [Alphaproteobacteria bacterium]|nr:hypothetical protein [Alphaproteobacteria bacterium]
MSFEPAISDADLARLLGLASAAPPLPDGLVDRIIARLPAAPPLPAPRRHARRRWLRPGLAIGASLVLASAVAAGLANPALLRPVIAPLLERLGVAAPPPARPTRPARAVAPPPAA